MNAIIFTVFLILHMPGAKPDVMGKIQVDNEATCIEMATEWVQKGLTERERELGAVGVGGGCSTNKPAVEI
jgi:hypothetical protein